MFRPYKLPPVTTRRPSHAYCESTVLKQHSLTVVDVKGKYAIEYTESCRICMSQTPHRKPDAKNWTVLTFLRDDIKSSQCYFNLNL